MPKRIPVKKIILHRDGKLMSPELHQEFDFTAEELADINRINPASIRKVVIEDKEMLAAAEQAEKDEAARAAKEAADAGKKTNTPAQAAKAKTSAADL